MISKSRLGLGYVMMALVGCTSIPPHPIISPPTTTRSGIKMIPSEGDLRHTFWWRKMHDPALNHLICEALAQNNQLKTAEANVLQAQARLNEARFAWLPTLNASGNGFVGGGWDTDFSPKGPLASSPVFNQLGSIHFRGYSAGFVPDYTLNLWANINKNKYAYAALEMQKATYQSAKLSVISQISGAYFMLLGQKEQLKDLLQLIQDEKNLRKLEWKRYKNGAGDLSKVTRVDQNIAGHRSSVPAIESSIAQIENAIQVLLNHNPGALVRHGHLSRLSVRHLIPANLPAAVLKNRPDIMAATYQLKMSEYNLGIAYSHFFPTINLTGLLGGASVALSHVLSLSTGLWIAQAAASVPLLNGVTHAQIQEAKAGYHAAFYTYLQTVRSVFSDVDNALTNQLKVNQAYAARLKGLHDAKRLYDFAVARYNLGAKDAREVAQEKLNMDEAKLNLTLAKMQQLDGIVQVYQALAGGYGA